MSRGVRVVGFTTQEIRERGHRIGFHVEGLSGGRATLAHIDLLGPPRVGKYGVDIASFELVGLPSLAEAASVVVIDELGKMELASDASGTPSPLSSRGICGGDGPGISTPAHGRPERALGRPEDPSLTR